MPVLTPRGIDAALRRLPEDEIDIVMRERIFAAAWAPGTIHYATGSGHADALAAAAGLDVRAIADSEDLKRSMQKLFAPRLYWLSAASLPNRMPGWSARLRLLPGQTVAASLCLLLLVLAIILVPWPHFRTILGLVFSVFFLGVIALRILSALPLPRQPRPAVPEELPTYSVLVPLFREVSVLDQLLESLNRLDYPPHLLDIKLVIEKTDLPMRRALGRRALPPHMEIILVPPVGPQTKPKALNYALAFARGDLLTIYDAEDIPHPGQLRAAAARFASAHPRVACLQAELTFYNPSENWLARQFTAEYAWLFGRMLPVLGHLGLPILLGGTSNHFRTHVLREIGAWDAYNVTEDADLGMRLARLGYFADVLPSRTYEEANCQLRNWISQRARWLKGWMQTWLVHMRSPVRLHADLGARGFWTAQALLLGVIISALFHPLFLAFTLWAIFAGEFLPGNSTPFTVIATGINLAVLLSGYAASIYAAALGLERRGLRNWYWTLATMPAYWLLISIAAWLALWQLIRAPFHWNKTEHGISRVLKRKTNDEPRLTPLPGPSRALPGGS